MRDQYIPTAVAALVFQTEEPGKVWGGALPCQLSGDLPIDRDSHKTFEFSARESCLNKGMGISDENGRFLIGIGNLPVRRLFGRLLIMGLRNFAARRSMGTVLL